MPQVTYQRAPAVMKLASFGLLVGIAVMLTGRGAVSGAQDPAGPGRGQAAATGRGPAADSGHNLTRPDLPNPFRGVENIVTMPPGRTMGSTNAINVDSKGNIWFNEFATNSIGKLDPNTMEPMREVVPGRTLLAIAAWIDEIRLIDNIVL